MSPMTTTEKEMFHVAANLSKDGNIAGAISILEELTKINPNSALFRAVLANSYEEIGKHELAEVNFKAAIHLKPEWELASLGLFHCLWGQGRKDEALLELKRFMAISYCKDYIDIIEEINLKAQSA